MRDQLAGNCDIIETSGIWHVVLSGSRLDSILAIRKAERGSARYLPAIIFTITYDSTQASVGHRRGKISQLRMVPFDLLTKSPSAKPLVNKRLLNLACWSSTAPIGETPIDSVCSTIPENVSDTIASRFLLAIRRAASIDSNRATIDISVSGGISRMLEFDEFAQIDCWTALQVTANPRDI